MIRRERVLVTGIGLRLPLGPEGTDRETAWRAVRTGRSQTRAFSLGCLGRENGPVEYGFPAPYRERFSPGFDPLPSLLLDAAVEAADDARLFEGNRLADPARSAVLVGLSKGRPTGLELRHARALRGFATSGTGSGSADWLDLWPSSGAERVAGLLGFRGPRLAPIAACATGLVAAIQGAEMIRRGICDRAVVGAADASLTPFLLAAFRRMRALAAVADGDDPAAAVRPWDRRRQGFLVGEGAALLVLEREDLARARGVLPYAELAGGALGSDAYHLTDLNPDPVPLASLIGRALDDARVSAAEVDYVNVHGTATRSNDPLECRALRGVLGASADRVSCTANKGQIGHLLGAAGAVELAITCLAIRDQFAPPTLNLTDPDPACDLDATPGVGRERPIAAAIKLSLGFGGHLAAAVLRRPRGPRREGPDR